MIPQLETPRLMLRAFTSNDLDAWAAIMADPDVTRYIAPTPMTRDEAWRSMASSLGHWMLRGYGAWAVQEKATGDMVGRVGMINPEGWPALEIGWTLGKSSWGKGYATEAAEAAIRYAFLTQPVDRLISCIDPDNTSSQRVAVRLGETKGERTALRVAGKDYPVDIWSISRGEWLRRIAGQMG
ncbi:MAG: GNAT family N-acetyltransferase [Alphaproteobacteria bacterium]|nr:GNAT family N-acetyltransferase [Alphaproteobacteria bacterium]MBL6936660.1 GNAT family N-acetyltransferase [Alphaproteobacteria bacterium]MBL7097429.1 GNAT family N-acetyltransferase [Alphaproteobacteria bacterium]